MAGGTRPERGNLTVPNILTIGRILLTPAFVLAFLDERYGLAWLIFAIAGVSDGLDGFLAKKLDQRTRLGAMLDPLADKALLVTAFVCLAWRGLAPTWLAVLVVSRDTIIVGGLAVLRFAGVAVEEHIRPVPASKLNTLCQIFLVFLLLTDRTLGLGLSVLPGLLTVLVATLTAVSCIQYVVIGVRLLPPERGE
jgi:cardiolipin synthase